MASSLLEQTREAHDEVERLERLVVTDFRADAVTHKERLLQNHRVNRILDEMVTKTKRLRSVYEAGAYTRPLFSST
jgi:splicing factor 3A subunit 3